MGETSLILACVRSCSHLLFGTNGQETVFKRRYVHWKERRSSMEGNANVYKGAFLSRGGDGYTAPSSRKPSIEAVIQNIRHCKSELTLNMIVLQQAALEQERTEQRFERLAEVVNMLIEVVKPLEVGSVVTDQRIRERDQAIMRLQGILSETPPNESP
jgi:hypothetical protein